MHEQLNFGQNSKEEGKPAKPAGMSSNELSVEMDSCIRTFKEHMHLELEPPKIPGVVGGKRGATSPKLSPRSSPRLFRKLMVNKSIRQRRRFTVAHTW